MLKAFKWTALAVFVLADGYAATVSAMPVAPVKSAPGLQTSDIETVAVRRGASRGGNVNRSRNVGVNRNVNRNVNRTVNRNVNVVGRPVRGWARRPYYGTVIGGVALGTIIAVSAAGAVPSAPADNMCWFWSDSSQRRGYWDYCVAP